MIKKLSIEHFKAENVAVEVPILSALCMRIHMSAFIRIGSAHLHEFFTKPFIVSSLNCMHCGGLWYAKIVLPQSSLFSAKPFNFCQQQFPLIYSMIIFLGFEGKLKL